MVETNSSNSGTKLAAAMLLFAIAGMLPMEGAAQSDNAIRALGMHNRRVDADLPGYRAECSSQYQASVRDSIADGNQVPEGRADRFFKQARNAIYFGRRSEVEEKVKALSGQTSISARLDLCASQLALRTLDDTEQLNLAAVANAPARTPSAADTQMPALEVVATGRPRSTIQEILLKPGQINWNVVTTDKGCIAFLHLANFKEQMKAITWSGNCRTGQAITGTGTLTILDSDKDSWSGPFLNGFLNGKVTVVFGSDRLPVATYNMGCDVGSEHFCAPTRPVQAKGTPGSAPAAIRADPPSPARNLPNQQVVSCSEEIKNKQIESQSWGGDANDVAARLGQFQKSLFEGRCAGHPEAQAYIAGANKMLGYGGNAAGSGGGSQSGTSSQRTRSGSVNEGTSSGNLAPIRRDTQSTEHNPVHNATNCIKIYDPSEIKALGLRGTVLPTKMVNTCPYSVSVTWCVVAKDGRSGDCNPGYSNLLNLSGTGEKGSNSYGVNAYYQEVRYAACRYGKNMGFQRVEKDSGNPFRFSCS